MCEENIIRMAKNGEHYSFNVLLNPYVERAHQTAFLLLRDYNLAEDAVQEALIQTFYSLKRFDPQRASFKTWFNSIVINCSLKLVRKRRFSFEIKDIRNTPSSLNEPEGTLLIKEDVKIISDYIKKLKTKYQTVVILYYFQEMSIKEIAQTLEINEGTVKSRLYKSRELLKNLMQDNINLKTMTIRRNC